MKYKKWSLPVSVFILTIIAVAVSSIKRRGGMGVNLAFGIAIAMVYVFFDKVFGVMAEQSDFPPIRGSMVSKCNIWYFGIYLLTKCQTLNLSIISICIYWSLLLVLQQYLGELITIGSLELVWYRMTIAGILMVCLI